MVGNSAFQGNSSAYATAGVGSGCEVVKGGACQDGAGRTMPAEFKQSMSILVVKAEHRDWRRKANAGGLHCIEKSVMANNNQ
jgi:hypothetical protein